MASDAAGGVTAATAAPFTRSATTWIRYGQLGLVAFVIDGYAPTLRLVAQDLRIPLALMALHATALGLGFILGPFAATRLTGRFGRPSTAWTGAAGLSAGVLLYLTSSALPGTLSGMFIAGFAGTLVQSAAYADLAVTHRANSARAISEGSAVSQAAGVLAPLAVGLASLTVLGWRAGLAVVILLAGLIGSASALHRCRTEPASARGARPDTTPPAPAASAVLGGVGSLAAVLGIEFCLSVWAPVELSTRPGVPGAVASASPALMLVGIMGGRLLLGPLTRRWSVDLLLLVSIGLSAAGFAVFWCTPQPWLGLVALAVAGLGVAGQFPLSLARLVQVSGGRPDDASAARRWHWGWQSPARRFCSVRSAVSSASGTPCCSCLPCASPPRPSSC